MATNKVKFFWQHSKDLRTFLASSMKGQCCHRAAASAKRAALRWHRGRGGLRVDAEGRPETGCWRGRAADCRLLAAGGGLLTQAGCGRRAADGGGQPAGDGLLAGAGGSLQAACRRQPVGCSRGRPAANSSSSVRTGGAASVVLGPAAAAVLAPTALGHGTRLRAARCNLGQSSQTG